MFNNIKLKPKVDLFDPNFDGYKLYPETFQQVSTKSIEHGITNCSSSEPNCYLYTRMESLHNHLFFDTFDIYNIFVFNAKGHLMMFTYLDGYLNCLGVVWQEDISLQNDQERILSITKISHSPSLMFPSSSLAVTTNGDGILNILQTGDRGSGTATTWINVLDMTIATGRIVHSLHIELPDHKIYTQEMHVLILSLSTAKDLKEEPLNNLCRQLSNCNSSSTLHLIYWLTFNFDGDKWLLTRERRIAGFNNLEFLSLDASASGIVSLSHDQYFFIYDSLQPVETLEKEKPSAKKESIFIFTQNGDELSLFLNVPSGILKEELLINVSANKLELKIKDDIILNYNLLHAVESCAVTWSHENEKLAVVIPKSEEGLQWETLFEGGNYGGEEVPDKTLVEEVHQKLAHLTSDKWNPQPENDNPPFNPGQLEACDDASEDLVLTIIDGNSHLVSHSANLGAVQHLFNTQMTGENCPSFCLRHDVDGVLWAVKEDRTFEHVSTFNAFGYVKASKSMAKFTKASPDNSYVAIADVNSHVYIFCQPEALGSELRNRKSGKRTATIARQMILSLRNHEEVMGFHCTPNALFILTRHELFAYSLDCN